MIEDLLIVAAGEGTRLRRHGELKPLVPVAGTPLIEFALRAAISAGVRRAVIVVGYRADELSRFLVPLGKRLGIALELVHNPRFEEANGKSVLAAQDALQRPFFLAMCDHIVDPEIYRRLARAELLPGQVALGVDSDLCNPLVDLEDVTKVHSHNMHIQNIGKELIAYNGFDTGVFRASPALFDAIERSGLACGDWSISGGMKQLSARYNARAVDVSGSYWIDVDSPEMLIKSHQLIARAYEAA